MSIKEPIKILPCSSHEGDSRSKSRINFTVLLPSNCIVGLEPTSLSQFNTMAVRTFSLVSAGIAFFSASIASAQGLPNLRVYEPTLRDAIKNLEERVSTDPDPGEIYTTSLDGGLFQIDVNLYMQASCPNATFLHYPAYVPIGDDNFNYSARQAYHDFRGMAGDPYALIEDRVQAIQD